MKVTGVLFHVHLKKGDINLLKQGIKRLMPFELIKNQNKLYTHLKTKRKGPIMNADLIQKLT